MPTVPVVNDSPMNTPEFQGTPVAPSRNAAPDQIREFGAMQQSAGLQQMSVGAHIALRIQEQMDDANIKAAEGKFIEASTAALNDYLSKQGADALNTDQDAKQAIAKAKADLLDSLGNDIQKQKFSEVAQRHMVTFGSRIDQHKVEQRKDYTYGEAVTGSQSMRVMHSQAEIGSDDHKMYGAAAIQRLDDALRIRGIAEGSEQWKKAEKDLRTTLFEDDVNRLLNSNRYDAAKLYYAEHSGDLDTTTPQMQRIKKTIEDTTLAAKVQQVVTDSIGKGGTFEEQSQRVDAAFAGNPEGLKDARTEFIHRFQIHQQAQKIATEENFGKLWDMRFPTLPGQKAKPMSQIVQSPEWAALNGDQRNVLRSQWETYAKRNENDPSQVAQQYLNYFNLVNKRDPQTGELVYPKMSDAQIKGQLGSLGPQLTVQLMKDINEYRNAPVKLQQVEVDKEQLKTLAKDFGLIKGDKPDDAESMMLGRLEIQLKTLQQNSGQKWSYENTDKLIRQLLTPIVTHKGWFSDTKQPFFEVRATESIPQAFIDATNKKFTDKGQAAPNPIEMYQLWFSAKDAGLVDEKGNPK